MTPETALLLLIWAALALYGLLGGADFGAGVWEFNTALSAPPEERRLLYRAIGPVWEANHVWLIYAIVLLLTGFPLALAAACQALWLPLLLALAGIVFRGAAYAFRVYAAYGVAGPWTDRQRAFWGAVFALASTAAPFFLGASVGALASGRLAFDASGAYTGHPLLGWLDGFALFGGFYGVGICAYLAAVYLVREARLEGDAALEDAWRRRAMASGFWMGVLSATGLLLARLHAPALWAGLSGDALPAIAVSAAAGLGSLAALAARRPALAVIGAAGAVVTVLAGWALAQYPFLVPPAITVEDARAPESVIRAVLAGSAAGGAVLLPSLAWLFYLFKTRAA